MGISDSVHVVFFYIHDVLCTNFVTVTKREQYLSAVVEYIFECLVRLKFVQILFNIFVVHM